MEIPKGKLSHNLIFKRNTYKIIKLQSEDNRTILASLLKQILKR